MPLAAEAEMVVALTNSQLALPIRHALESGLDHPQPPTPLKLDNSTTTSFANKNMPQRRSKHWDMRYHWIRDKEIQKLMRVH